MRFQWLFDKLLCGTASHEQERIVSGEVKRQKQQNHWRNMTSSLTDQVAALRGPPSGSHASLGPRNLDEFVGQRRAVERLMLAMECARRERRAIDPVLITGPSGTGKSTLIRLVAEAQGARPLIHRSAAEYTIDQLREDLAATKAGQARRGMVILDELHAADPKVRDTLLVVMDGCSDSPKSNSSATRSMSICGLTNRTIPVPLRRRFPIQIQLGLPSRDEIIGTIELFARQTGTCCEPDAVHALARIAFTPGNARNLFIEARTRSVALERPLDLALVLETLWAMGIDPRTGLDELQFAAIRYLCDVKRAGRQALMAFLGVDEEAVYQSVEDTLIRRGYITVTSRGREPTARAFRLIGDQE